METKHPVTSSKPKNLATQPLTKNTKNPIPLKGHRVFHMKYRWHLLRFECGVNHKSIFVKAPFLVPIACAGDEVEVAAIAKAEDGTYR